METVTLGTVDRIEVEFIPSWADDGSGWLTLNALRRLESLPPVPSWDDDRG